MTNYIAFTFACIIHQEENAINKGNLPPPQPKLFGPDIFRWGGDLPREGAGAKKFGMPLETQENKFFGRGVLVSFGGISGSAQKNLLCSILAPTIALNSSEEKRRAPSSS